MFIVAGESDGIKDGSDESIPMSVPGMVRKPHRLQLKSRCSNPARFDRAAGMCFFPIRLDEFEKVDVIDPEIRKETVYGFLIKFKRVKNSFQLSDLKGIPAGRAHVNQSEPST
jgi:hypothetical protein